MRFVAPASSIGSNIDDGASFQARGMANPPDLQCASCEVMFGENVGVFLAHMSEEHADDLIRCIQCGQTLDGGGVFAAHYMDEHFDAETVEASAGEELNCPMCAFSSPDEVALTAHFESVHGDGEEDGAVAPASTSSTSTHASSDLLCPVCEAAFDSERALSVHVNGHFDGSSFYPFRCHERVILDPPAQQIDEIDAETRRLINEYERERERAEAASFRQLQVR